MQSRNDKSWEDILREIRNMKLQVFELTQENTRLQEENKQLLNRLGIAEAYRFCDKQSVIID